MSRRSTGQGFIDFAKLSLGTKTNWRFDVAVVLAIIFTALNSLRPATDFGSKSAAPFASALYMLGFYLLLNLVVFSVARILLSGASTARPRWQVGLFLLVSGALAIRIVQSLVELNDGKDTELVRQDIEGFVSSAVMGPTVFIAIAGIRQMIEVLKELQSRSESLSELIEQGSESLRTMRTNISAEVNQTLVNIRSSLAKSQSVKDIDPKKFSRTLQAATSKTLSLMELMEKVERDSGSSSLRRPAKGATLPSVKASSLFSAESLATFFVLLLFFRWAIYDVDAIFILSSALIGLVFVATVLTTRNLSGTVSFAVSIAIKLVFGMVAVLGTNFLYISAANFPISAFARALLVSLIYVASTSAHLIYEQSVRNIKQVNDDLARELSLLERETWAIKNHYQNTIHGTLKASLFYASLKAGQETTTDDDLRNIRATLEEALRAENFDVQSNQSIEQQLDGIFGIWRNVAKVSLAMNSNCKKIIDSNLETQDLVREIVREAVANALRHGNATEVSVRIIDVPQNLQITCINNGNLVPEKLVTGSGSAMLDKLCLDWSLKSANVEDDNQTILQATIASPKNNPVNPAAVLA